MTPHRPETQPSGDAGLTLVEVLVALAIFSLIAVTGSTLTLSTLRGEDVQAETLDDLQQLQRATALFRADMDQMVARQVRDEYGLRQPYAFVGGSRIANRALLSLVRGGVTNPLFADRRSDLAQVDYILREDGALIRRSRVWLDPVLQTPVQEKALFSDVRSARVRFYRDGLIREDWLVEPQGPRNWPDAVELVIESARWGELRIMALAPGSRG